VPGGASSGTLATSVSAALSVLTTAAGALSFTSSTLLRTQAHKPASILVGSHHDAARPLLRYCAASGGYLPPVTGLLLNSCTSLLLSIDGTDRQRDGRTDRLHRIAGFNKGSFAATVGLSTETLKTPIFLSETSTLNSGLILPLSSTVASVVNLV